MASFSYKKTTQNIGNLSFKFSKTKKIEHLRKVDLTAKRCDDRLNSESGVKIKYAAGNTGKKIVKTFQLFTLRGMLRPPKTNTKCLRRRKVKGL